MTGSSQPYACGLDELRRADESSFGGKSAGLGELLAAGIRVPPGFALSTAAFAAFLSESGLEGRVGDLLGRAEADDVEAIGAAAHAIGEAMRSAPMPRAVREEITARYAALAATLGETEPPVAVRSSAVGEDAADATYAGQQETYLWVRGAEHVSDAVRDCWVSLFSAPAISYRAQLASAPEPSMGVTVQLMVDAEVSGVLFTCNPVSGDPSMIAINASWGLGLAVVGGDVTPDDYLVSKVTREVVREHVHAKDVEYVPHSEGRGAVRIEVPEARRHVPCLGRDALETLVDVGRRVEGHFGSFQDVEWAIARGGALPESLYVVQSRPVTTAKRPKGKPATDALSLVMSTFGVVPPDREN